MADHEVIIPEGTEATYERFQFAPAVKKGNTIYVSGVIGTGPGGSVLDNAADEFAAAFTQLSETLELAGASLADVVELTSFHVNIETELGAFMKAKAEVMNEPHPAWTAIGCSGLAIPGTRAEVKATAIVD